jgi:hypothetical protein
MHAASLARSAEPSSKEHAETCEITHASEEVKDMQGNSSRGAAMQLLGNTIPSFRSSCCAMYCLTVIADVIVSYTEALLALVWCCYWGCLLKMHTK